VQARLAEIGSVQAMGPGKEPNDGRGHYVEAITDSHIRAARQLAHVRSVKALPPELA
jgi:hypothetical protein